jgi:hypothetical protein
MKNYSPIYTILATMAVAAIAIGAEPIRHNSKQLELSKTEATKAGYELVVETAGSRLPGRRILILDARDFEAGMSANVAVAIATARARKRTG